MSIFGKPKSTTTNIPQKRKGVPDGQWIKCEDCSDTIYKKTLDKNFKVCSKCNFHFTLPAYERITLFTDEASFEEFDKDMTSTDPLGFKGPKAYTVKLEEDKKATGMADACVIGKALLEKITGKKAVAVLNKCDLVHHLDISRLPEILKDNTVQISALTGSGTDGLLKKISDALGVSSFDNSQPVCFTGRQEGLLEHLIAAKSDNEAVSAITELLNGKIQI